MRFYDSLITIGLLCLFLQACTSTRNTSFNNMVAKMQVDKPIPGVCDNSMVIAILPLPGNGQEKAQAPMTDEAIEAKLNEEVTFLKGKSDYKDEGMVSLIINCKGEMVRCEIDNKTQSPELDAQIVAIFAEMKSWKAGSLNGKPVDTVELYSFTIEEGIIAL